MFRYEKARCSSTALQQGGKTTGDLFLLHRDVCGEPVTGRSPATAAPVLVSRYAQEDLLARHQGICCRRAERKRSRTARAVASRCGFS